jgi:hypothetical protein
MINKGLLLIIDAQYDFCVSEAGGDGDMEHLNGENLFHDIDD